jgi:hypothetical protein
MLIRGECEAPADLGIGSAGASPAPVGTVGPRWNRGLVDFRLLLALVKPIRSPDHRELYSSQGKLERADRWKSQLP